MTAPPSDDIAGATVAIGDQDDGLDMLVVDGPDGRTFDLAPLGAADVIDEGAAAIRLTRETATALAVALFELLTDR